MNNKLAISLSALITASSLLAACVGSGATSPPSPPLDKLGEIMERGRLVVSTETAYPPQSELKPEATRAANTKCAPAEYTANQFRGFDTDVAVELAKRLGVEPCFVTPTWTQVTSGSWGDRWDISVGSMVITPERMEVLYFTQPYASGSAVFFVHKDNRTFTQPSDLLGKKIGVCAGCAYEFYLEGSLVVPGQKIGFVVKDAAIVGYDTDTSALEDLAVGDGTRLDAVLTDPDTGQNAIKNGMPIKQLGDPVYNDYVAAAIDKKSSRDPVSFARKVTEIIQQMHHDGTLLKLSQQYYGGDFATTASRFNIDALGQFP
jgi:polar amino acid transport system substrate-binding protein